MYLLISRSIQKEKYKKGFIPPAIEVLYRQEKKMYFVVQSLIAIHREIKLLFVRFCNGALLSFLFISKTFVVRPQTIIFVGH